MRHRALENSQKMSPQRESREVRATKEIDHSRLIGLGMNRILEILKCDEGYEHSDSNVEGLLNPTANARPAFTVVP
jgi:hypothetical protein